MNYHRNLLIIDDSAEDRFSYCRYLRQDSHYTYHFFEAETGEEALEICQTNSIDVVLLDYLLPDINGIEFLEELIQVVNPLPPTVMLTGQGNEAIAVAAMKIGVKDYLVKRQATSDTIRLAINRAIETTRLEQLVERSEARFRTSVENMLDCFGIYRSERDSSGDIVKFEMEYLNTAAYEDLRLAQQQRLSVASYFNHQLFQQCCKVVENNCDYAGEIKITTDDHQNHQKTRSKRPTNANQFIAYDVRIAKLEDGFVATWRNITGRKKSEQLLQQKTFQLEIINSKLKQITTQLKRRNVELDEFAYIISHDLKAPLRAINNLSLWLQEDLEQQLDPESQRHLELMRQRVERMNSLIDGMLAYSRVGRVEESSSQICIQQLLQETIDSVDLPVAFKIDLCLPLPTLNTPVVLLQQIFANLIGNAVKHHHRSSGVITIKSTEEDDYYQFSVTDDGPGISPQHHDKIFSVFQTIESAQKTDSTGIGLAIVKKIVESYGGKVWLSSQLGVGTTFYFTWPKTLNPAIKVEQACS